MNKQKTKRTTLFNIDTIRQQQTILKSKMTMAGNSKSPPKRDLSKSITVGTPKVRI